MSLRDIILSDLKSDALETTVKAIEDFSVSIGTSLGMVRKSNEDRVVFASLYNENLSSPIYVSIVSDGMGGMRDGSLASAIAVSSFISRLNDIDDEINLKDWVSKSLEYSNEEVYKTLNGEGGATFSVLVINSDKIVYANVGDSRIYSASKELGLTLLTKDDDVSNLLKENGLSIDESILNRKGLVKFVGMDTPLEVSVMDGSYSGSYVMLTDGIYRIGQKLMANLYSNSSDDKEFVYRVISVANWMGGVDNSSCFTIDVDSFNVKSISTTQRYGVIVWGVNFVSSYSRSVYEERKEKRRGSSKKKSEKLVDENKSSSRNEINFEIFPDDVE